jgi:hypothetical protein
VIYAKFQGVIHLETNYMTLYKLKIRLLHNPFHHILLDTAAPDRGVDEPPSLYPILKRSKRQDTRITTILGRNVQTAPPTIVRTFKYFMEAKYTAITVDYSSTERLARQDGTLPPEANAIFEMPITMAIVTI